MIVELEESKLKIADLKKEIDELGAALKVDEKRAEIAELEKESSDESFWSDSENSGKVLRKLKSLKSTVEKYEKLQARADDTSALIELGIEENDDGVVEEVLSELEGIAKETDERRTEVLLSGEYYSNNAIV